MAPQDSGLKRTYLIAYNAVSATLWFGVLARVAILLATQGESSWEEGRVYGELEWYARVVQTGAVAEVGHSVLGTLLTALPLDDACTLIEADANEILRSRPRPFLHHRHAGS